MALDSGELLKYSPIQSSEISRCSFFFMVYETNEQTLTVIFTVTTE